MSAEMDTARMPRLAVFGGSFDPPHNGHLFVAGEMLREAYVDEVLFVPAANPPHKLDQRVTAVEHRMKMLALALGRCPAFSYTDIELQRDAPSYTIETLEVLTGLYAEYRLRFVMGMDSLQDIHRWHRASELVSHYSFIVFPRPGIPVPSHGMLAEHFGPVNAAKLIRSVADVPSVPIASRIIRECYRNGKTVSGLLPESVQVYVEENALYRR